jgi:hypothetical protein
MRRSERKNARAAARLIAEAQRAGHTLALVRQPSGEILMTASTFPAPAPRRLHHKMAVDGQFYAEVWRRLLQEQGVLGLSEAGSG